MLTAPDNIRWNAGFESIEIFRHPERDFTKAFCKKCGCGVPYINRSGKYLVVPAGSLKDEPSIKPQANLFSIEQTGWCKVGETAKSYDGFMD